MSHKSSQHGNNSFGQWLSLRQKGLGIFLGFCFFTLALRWLGFARLYSFLRRTCRAGARRSQDVTLRGVSAQPKRSGEEATREAWRIARWVRLAARYSFWRSTCLERALLLWWLLQRQGIASDLRLGVRKENGVLEAHAWVEFEGHLLGDRAEALRPFTPFSAALFSAGDLGL